MPNAVVMTGYGPPEVLKWAGVPLREPGEGQIRIKVKAAGISPTDLALRAGYLKEIPLPPDTVLGFAIFVGLVEAVTGAFALPLNGPDFQHSKASLPNPLGGVASLLTIH